LVRWSGQPFQHAELGNTTLAGSDYNRRTMTGLPVACTFGPAALVARRDS
jgi:hypothetical protein